MGALDGIDASNSYAIEKCLGWKGGVPQTTATIATCHRQPSALRHKLPHPCHVRPFVAKCQVHVMW